MISSDTQATQKLPDEIYHIEKKLEEARLAAFNATKGLFKRAFFKSWIVLSVVITLMVILPFEADGFDIGNVIGPVAISLFLSLAGAGIYVLIRKISYNYKFESLSKKSLVPKIIAFVNPDLTFSNKGILKKEFDKAELFRGLPISEDTIEGTIEGTKIIFSECTVKGSFSVNFKGPFIQIDMKHLNVSTPLKIFPSIIIENHRALTKHQKKTHGRRPGKSIEFDEKDRVLTNLNSKYPKYEFYCKSEQEAKNLLTPQLLKVVEFFYTKYGDKNIFISFHQDKCYLAYSKKGESYIDIPQEEDNDMFDTSTFLKENLVDSHFADQVHRDAQFVNTLIKEISLINAV